MTPAEKLSAAKPWRRAPRNTTQSPRKASWACEVRARREALRLSLRDVAAAVKLSVTALHQIEHGTDPMLTTARRIAVFFGATTDELWPALLRKATR
jgi:DNA-binding XRE family transcriptional regulator